MRRPVISLALLAVAASGFGAPPQPPVAPEPLSCGPTVVAGRVEKGEAFAAPFADELVFRLDPETHPANPKGWTIRVTPASDPAIDYLEVATPPYRFSNPRYVDTSYGLSAARALEWSPRGFLYVASRADYQIATDSLGVLLWSGEHSEAEIEAAQSAMTSLATYEGRLWIEAGETTSPDDDGDPEIAWLKFRVELRLPPSER